MKNYIGNILLLGMFLFLGCNDNETLEPTDFDEFSYTLPQGEHDYDDKIVEWNNRTGVYILYKFDPSDVYFSFTGWMQAYEQIIVNTRWFDLDDETYVENDSVYFSESTVYPLDEYIYDDDGLWGIYRLMDESILYEFQRISSGGQFKVDEPLEEYVGNQLLWLEEMFLNHYPDKILEEYLPLKIILSRGLASYNPANLQFKIEDYYLTFNNLILNYGDESIENLTLADKNRVKKSINNWFIQRFISLFDFEEFLDVTDYYWAGISYGPGVDEMYVLGMLTDQTQILDLTGVQNSDITNYINMILEFSYEQLNMDPDDVDYDSDDESGTRKGFLDPKKDVNGLIRQKYDLMIDAFNKLGIDLQAIGNLYND